jgi:O-antigen ligase/polysaccharide polymerase Wzy-like membrane protein
MNTLYSGAYDSPRRDWITGLIGALVVIAAGMLLGYQIMQPDKRVLALMAAAVVFGIAWRVDMVMGLGFLLLALPYPRSMSFGSSNLAFILILLVIWLLRMSQREAPLPRRTPIDIPITSLLIAYVVSFYNVEGRYVRFALGNFGFLLSGVLLFYLLVNNVRTTRDFKRLHTFQLVSLGTVLLLGMWELAHPGAIFIPGWIDFGNSELRRGGLNAALHDIRIGGPFFDYELLCEYCGIMILLLMFLLAQARNPFRRTVLAVLLGGTVIALFATVTRGGFVAALLGVGYLLWIIRRRIKVVPAMIIGVAAIAFLFGLDYYVSQFTNAGDLLERMHTTKFVGWMPESRSHTWPEAFARMMRHPIIGYGPYYAVQTGTVIWFWPHCLYLYLGNLVGLVGLGCFLWLMATLWGITRPQTDRLGDSNYGRGFLLAGHVQLFVFLVDEIKIEFLRNPIYIFQVWIMFASIVIAHRIAKEEAAAEPRPA